MHALTPKAPFRPQGSAVSLVESPPQQLHGGEDAMLKHNPLPNDDLGSGYEAYTIISDAAPNYLAAAVVSGDLENGGGDAAASILPLQQRQHAPRELELERRAAGASGHLAS